MKLFVLLFITLLLTQYSHAADTHIQCVGDGHTLVDSNRDLCNFARAMQTEIVRLKAVTDARYIEMRKTYDELGAKMGYQKAAMDYAYAIMNNIRERAALGQPVMNAQTLLNDISWDYYSWIYGLGDMRDQVIDLTIRIAILYYESSRVNSSPLPTYNGGSYCQKTVRVGNDTWVIATYVRAGLFFYSASKNGINTLYKQGGGEALPKAPASLALIEGFARSALMYPAVASRLGENYLKVPTVCSQVQ